MRMIASVLLVALAPQLADAQTCAQSGLGGTPVSEGRPTDAMARELIGLARKATTDYDRCRLLARALPGVRTRSAAADWYIALRGVTNEFELAELLLAAARSGLLESPGPEAYFFSARRITNAWELRRVLNAALASRSTAVHAQLLRTAPAIGADYELASLLVEFARAHPVRGELRDAFVEASKQIRSEWEQERALNALADNPGRN